MRELTLFFENEELVEVAFKLATGEVRRTVRGKQSGARLDAGSFQWTSAVRGFALLATRTAARFEPSSISGRAKSLAASLDYAISKQPMWLIEMFGVDHFGTSLIRRMVLRTNPERKRPGPTTLAINEKYLTAEGLKIYSNGKPCSGADLVVLAVMLASELSESLQGDDVAEAA